MRRRDRAGRPALGLLSFDMPSRKEAVAPATERVVEAARLACLPEERHTDLAVAVAEALSNAALHGNRGQPAALVHVRVRACPHRCLEVEVEDAGPGFSHEGVVDPTGAEHVLRPGGRGVFLMRRLTDRLEYNLRGNRVRLVFDCPKQRR